MTYPASKMIVVHTAFVGFISLIFVLLASAQIDGDVRLVNGSSLLRGRVEIYHMKQWGTVCDDKWDLNAATVVCRQLGFDAAIAAPGNAFFGKGGKRQPTHLDDVRCTGFESSLAECTSNGWGKENCSHKEDAGVVCSKLEGDEELDIRLVGNSRGQGRVEVFHDDQWGALCSKNWRFNDAVVICGELGYLSASLTSGGGVFGQGNALQPHFVADMQCSGREKQFSKCLKSALITTPNCSEYQDVGVVCSNEAKEGSVRLVAGSSRHEGRVEVLHKNEWRTICGRSWDINGAMVVCRELGLGPALVARQGGAYFGQGDSEEPMLQDKIVCRGNETALRNCSRRRMGANKCERDKYAGIVCMVQDKPEHIEG